MFIVFTHLSFSNLLRLQMFNAVCLTIVPTTCLLITIPSTSGVARFVLKKINSSIIVIRHFLIVVFYIQLLVISMII